MSKSFFAISLILVFCCASALMAAEPDVWTFKEIRVFNTSSPDLLQIISPQADINGGDVAVEVSGKAGNFCPDGTESLRFRWKFTNDITTIHPGSIIGMGLEAGQVRATGTCTTAITDRSLMAVNGSDGVGNGFPDTEQRFLEIGRFYTKEDGRIDLRNANRTSSAAVGVSTSPWNPAAPEKTLAFFQIVIITPTREGGGIIRYTYVYEKGARSSGGLCDMSGKWTGTSDEVFSFSQNGSQISGSGVTDSSWHFSGSIQGKVVTGQWSNSKDSGRLILIINRDCDAFSSAWGLGENYSTWSGGGHRNR